MNEVQVPRAKPTIGASDGSRLRIKSTRTTRYAGDGIAITGYAASDFSGVAYNDQGGIRGGMMRSQISSVTNRLKSSTDLTFSETGLPSSARSTRHAADGSVDSTVVADYSGLEFDSTRKAVGGACTVVVHRPDGSARSNTSISIGQRGDPVQTHSTSYAPDGTVAFTVTADYEKAVFDSDRWLIGGMVTYQTFRSTNTLRTVTKKSFLNDGGSRTTEINRYAADGIALIKTVTITYGDSGARQSIATTKFCSKTGRPRTQIVRLFRPDGDTLAERHDLKLVNATVDRDGRVTSGWVTAQGRSAMVNGSRTRLWSERRQVDATGETTTTQRKIYGHDGKTVVEVLNTVSRGDGTLLSTYDLRLGNGGNPRRDSTTRYDNDGKTILEIMESDYSATVFDANHEATGGVVLTRSKRGDGSIRSETTLSYATRTSTNNQPVTPRPGH